jgi:hypothetical protein
MLAVQPQPQQPQQQPQQQPSRKPMRNRDDMDQMFDDLTDLTIQQRETIKSRYRFLMTEYRRRCLIYTLLFYVLRITMTVGSLVVPALLSLKSGPDNNDTLYWITWAISLAVTTSNGLTTLFKLDKRFFLLQAISEKLRSETWQYLALSGRYSGHFGNIKPSHKNQYVLYCYSLEKIRMNHVDEEFVRAAETKDTGGSESRDGDKGTAQPSTSNVPTPANPANLESPTTSESRRTTVPSSKAPSPARRDSTSTVGSDDTVVDMGNNKKEKGAPVSLHDGINRGTVSPSGTPELTVLPATSKV